jgi:hypothetical protein
MSRRLLLTMVVAGLFPALICNAQEREIKVRGDKKRVEGDGFWIYNDLPRGIDEAKTSGKPLLVVFRCIPCEACAQLDEDVVSLDPRVRELLDKFVPVRIVHANGLDLSLFQYDYDQSWAAFFLNADMTIYGRYGTRSHERESKDDVSLEGFAKALTGALELHTQFPKHKAALAAKRGPDSDVKVPEQFPSLKGKYGSKLDYEGKVVQSCIHCHQVGEALRLVARSSGKPLSDKVLYPYPNPKALGLVLDPKERAKVKELTVGSSAEQAGFRVGDEITTLAGQPILSIADVQWVLHHAGDTATIAADVLRDGQPKSLTLTLTHGWRKRDDISWRATSWDLRRITLGGMRLESLPDDQRQELKIPAGELALRAKWVGQYNEHAVAKRAGFLKDDIILAIDGDRAPITESSLMTKFIQTKRTGDKVTMSVLRGGQRLELIFAQQ